MEEAKLCGLPVKIIGRNIVCYKKVTSTNDMAWYEVSKDAEEGTAVFADEQLRGRGRFGRDWFAPAGKGIWLSVVLKPKIPMERIFVLMAIGAISVAEVLIAKYNLPALIRWPNDVIVNDKKIAGVIIETKFIQKSPDAAVIGIGLNVNIDSIDLSDDLKGITTSILMEEGCEVEREPLAGDILCRLDKWYQDVVNDNQSAIKDVWRKLSQVLGKKVQLQSKGKSYEGEVVDLDPCEGIAIKQNDATTKWWRGEDVELLRIV